MKLLSFLYSKKSICLFLLLIVLASFTACNNSSTSILEQDSPIGFMPSIKEGRLLTQEEADKILPTAFDIDGDGAIATNSYWLTAQQFPVSTNLRSSIRANSTIGSGKTILFFTRLNNQWINFTSDLRLALENEGYTVLVQNDDQPLQDLSNVDVLAIIGCLGTPFATYNDRPLSFQDRTKIQNFISSGKGFFFSGDWSYSELSKYNEIAGMFGVTMSLQDIDYIPIYQNGYVTTYFLPYTWHAYVFDFVNFYQTSPSQPILKRAPLYGYSSFSNADHDIFKNVNEVLLLGSSYMTPKNLQIEAGVKTHPTTSRPRDYPITPEGYPLVVAKNYGSGRIVLSCDSNCFANDGFAKSDLAGTDNRVFAINVFNWLARTSSVDGALEIVTPSDNEVFESGQAINFTGSQAGNITNIEWISSIDGTFAVDTLDTINSTLSPGTHTITLQGIVGSPLPASIRADLKQSSNIRAASVGEAVSDSITITIEEPKPVIKVIGLDFLSGSGLDNRNRIYDRKETYKSGAVGDKFLEPTQWAGGIDSATGEVMESNNWPVSYVRNDAVSLNGNSSKIKLSVKVDDFKATTNPGPIEVNVVGTIYGENGFQQPITFPVTTFNPTSWPYTFPIESLSSLPNKIGKWQIEFNWSFHYASTNVGNQRTPKSGDFHLIYTTWSTPPEVVGDFQQHEDTMKNGSIIKKAEALPTFYLEILELSTKLLENSTINSDSDILSELLIGCKQLGDSNLFVFKLLGPSGWAWRGIDRFLTVKNGSCQEWSFFLQALIEVQGVDVLCRGLVMPAHPPYNINDGWRYASGMTAVGGVLPPSDPMNPSDPKYWKFLGHQFVTSKEAFQSSTVFDPSFNVLSIFPPYEDIMFPKLAIMLPGNIWSYHPKPNGLISKTPLDEWE